MSECIHVIEVLEATDGGTRTHLLHILRGLDRERFRLTLIASAERNPLFRRDMESLRQEGIEVIEVPMVRSISPFRDAAALIRLIRILRTMRDGIVHTHASKAGVLGRVAAKWVGARRTIHTPHVFYFEGKTGFARWFYRTVERAFASRTDQWVFLCEGQKRLAVAELGIEETRTVVIPNGVDPTQFKPRARKAEARAALGLPQDQPVIGHVTRFAPQKRTDLFLRALALVKRQTPAVRGVVVGYGLLEGELRRLAQALGIDGEIVWRDRCENPMEIYDALDVFALSSQYEGLPYTLLEAMSAGLPAVAPRISGCEEVVEDGVTGIVVPPGDPQALAAGIQKVLGNPPLAQSLGAAARRAVAERYRLSLFLRRMAALYASPA